VVGVKAEGGGVGGTASAVDAAAATATATAASSGSGTAAAPAPGQPAPPQWPVYLLLCVVLVIASLCILGAWTIASNVTISVSPRRK
jgi:hypothetical protein